jgi:hypothetical protein
MTTQSETLVVADRALNYWLDLFTGTTWAEFRNAGANITGFRERMRPRTRQVKRDDVLLCYLAGVMRWVGALEVGGPTNDIKSHLGLRCVSSAIRSEASRHARSRMRHPDEAV